MSAALDQADCTIVRKPCGCVTIMCVTQYIDKETKKEIADAIVEGCTVEHMTAAEAREQQFGCTHKPTQFDLLSEVA